MKKKTIPTTQDSAACCTTAGSGVQDALEGVVVAVGGENACSP